MYQDPQVVLYNAPSWQCQSDKYQGNLLKPLKHQIRGTSYFVNRKCHPPGCSMHTELRPLDCLCSQAEDIGPKPEARSWSISPYHYANGMLVVFVLPLPQSGLCRGTLLPVSAQGSHCTMGHLFSLILSKQENNFFYLNLL